jgi:nucleolar GTP-binding protein
MPRKKDNILKRIHLPQYEEIYQKVYKRVGRLIRKKCSIAPQSHEDELLDTAYNIIIDKLKPYQQFYKIVMGNDFYKTYIAVVLGEKALQEIREAAYLKNKVTFIYRMGKRRIRFSAKRDRKRETLNMMARMLSVIKRRRRMLERVLETKKELLQLPGRPDLPPVIIVGPPNSGKSTLMKRIAESKTRVGDYPFTTKKIVPGKLVTEKVLTIQILDTPGITDRSVKEMNIIEKRALAMLRIPEAIKIFLFDPSPQATLPLEKQLKLYNLLRQYSPLIIPVINKSDTYPEQAKKIKENLQETGTREKIYIISALTGEGIKNLIEEIKRKVQEHARKTLGKIKYNSITGRENSYE